MRGGGVPPAADLKHAGVVNEDVDAAERSERSFGDALRFDITGEIADRNPRAAPGLNDFVSDVAGFRFIASMDDDRRAFGGEGLAIASPIPLLLPVTSARLFSSWRFMA